MELFSASSIPRSATRSDQGGLEGPNLVQLDRVMSALDHHFKLLAELLMSAPCHLEGIPATKPVSISFVRPPGVLDGRRMISKWLSECDPCGARSLDAQIAESEIEVKDLIRSFVREAFGVDPYLPFPVAWPGNPAKSAMVAFADISSMEAQGLVIRAYGRLKSSEPSAASVLCVATFELGKPISLGLGPDTLPLPVMVK